MSVAILNSVINKMVTGKNCSKKFCNKDEVRQGKLVTKKPGNIHLDTRKTVTEESSHGKNGNKE